MRSWASSTANQTPDQQAMHFEPHLIAPDRYVPGIIVSVDGPMATVLVGVEQERWDFPCDLLPADSEPGRLLQIGLVDNRPTLVELDIDAEMIQPREVDDRLARLCRYERLTGHEVVAGR